MILTRIVRQKLKDFGFQPHLSAEVERMNLNLTACQLIVVVLSGVSIVFMFAPLFYLQDVRFMLVFFGLSLLTIIFCSWFWVKRNEICEHPEELQE